MSTTNEEDEYPDLYLPVTENYRISNKFCGYMDSISVDYNPMILVELMDYLIGMDLQYMQ